MVRKGIDYNIASASNNTAAILKFLRRYIDYYGLH